MKTIQIMPSGKDDSQRIQEIIASSSGGAVLDFAPGEYFLSPLRLPNGASVIVRKVFEFLRIQL